MRYILAGLHNGYINKYAEADLSLEGQAQYDARVHAINVDGDYIYAAGHNPSFSRNIRRYNLSDMSSGGESPLLNEAFALAIQGDYIYAGGLILTTDCRIRRYNLSNLS